jgi:death-on-curing protein
MPRRSPSTEPVWVSRLVLDAVHLDQVREHGGLPGVREETTLEAALARPQQRWHYEPQSDLATLAAAYGWGLVTSHPYRDGNKRMAFLAMAVFLGLNGVDIEATQEDVVTTMFSAAAGQLTEAQLAAWVRAHLVKLT